MTDAELLVEVAEIRSVWPHVDPPPWRLFFTDDELRRVEALQLAAIGCDYCIDLSQQPEGEH